MRPNKSTGLTTMQMFSGLYRRYTRVCLPYLVVAVWAGACCTASEAAIRNLPPAVREDNDFCLGCHDVSAHDKHAPRITPQALADSAHATLSCVACHRDVYAVPHDAPVAVADCIKCHNQSDRIELLAPDSTSFFGDSRHSAAMISHQQQVPHCTSCHGDHDVEVVSYQAPIADRCSVCHKAQAGDYWQSGHGKAVREGVIDAPTCQSCHPEHPAKGQARYPEQLITTKCVKCHENPGLQQRYSIPANRLASYLGSYHGAARELGDATAADCASCHGSHLILPAQDPKSSINPANLRKTCSQCHPNAGPNFAKGRIHIEPSLGQDQVVFLVKIGYQLLVFGMISAFLGYIGLDLLARIKRRMGESKRPANGEWEPQYERLSLNQRIQHWVLIISFVTLLATGLPLSFPRSEVSQTIVTTLGGMGTRAIVHRLAALVLIGIVGYHALYVLFSRRGYREFRELMPALQDAHDIIQMLKFYFGLTPIRVRFGRYNYIEKFEYLAVGWGSVVMIATGALLWAPHLSMMFVPMWVMDVALIVHSWEAILAFLAIIIWHMYNVHWNPSIFPMSRIWLTGKIGLHEFAANHPREYEQRRMPSRTEDD